MAHAEVKDHWSSDAYQKAAAFVPKLATKVVEWLDVQPSDNILDIGCGDGILTCHIAKSLTTGLIVGIDSSHNMISSATDLAVRSGIYQSCQFCALDARELLLRYKEYNWMGFDKVFSNAALHWILRDYSTRDDVLKGFYDALLPGGSFVFEMGGKGNVEEMRGAILNAVGKRVGEEVARWNDPWFFPDEEWMKAMLERNGFVVEKMELEKRPTKVEEGEGGGIDGWVRLMGKKFFDAVGVEGAVAREECIKEAVERLERDCKSPDGGHVIGYVRLRALARKPK